ncbi:MAG: FeoA family protein [Peptococcaceae bacterium]|nr:FeoA family protein [Peptococcaceae bacterium]
MSNMELNADGMVGQATNAQVKMQGMRIPLNRAEKNTEYTVEKVSGKDETKKHLNDLGFVTGEKIMVTSALDGNIIVTVKGVKIAVGEDLAKRVTVIC